MLCALPQRGKCEPQFLGGSEQMPASPPPTAVPRTFRYPSDLPLGPPKAPLHAEAPAALSAPETVVALPPKDYGGTGAAPKADQPLANFPSSPAYPAPRCRAD